MLCLLHLCIHCTKDTDASPAPSAFGSLVQGIEDNGWTNTFMPVAKEYAAMDVSGCYDKVLSIRGVKEWRSLWPYALETFEYSPEQFLGSSYARGIHRIGFAKKSQGIYYTPEDVISFMTEECERHFTDDMPCRTYLDCSCGAGAFLLHTADRILQRHEGPLSADDIAALVERSIWGIDISPAAVLNAKFLFMAYAYEKCPKMEGAQALWDTLESHIICGDAAKLPELMEEHPRMPKKFDCITGNPPYVTLDGHDNLCIRFVENMMAFSSERSSSALILPLSVTFSQSRSFSKLRQAIMDDKSATWRFASFDRTPDSLFGDHVKTRNTIVFRTTLESPRQILSTGIIRWTAENRDELFTDLKYADVQDVMDRTCIPKLQNGLELDAYRKLKRGGEPLAFLLWQKDGSGEHCVAVNGTAYNWICAYDHLPPSEDLSGRPYIPSSMALYTLPSQEDVYFCVAMLSNRITYWYWTATGDEFHVGSRLYDTLYLGKGSFSREAYLRIVSLGREYCSSITKYPTCSYNAGKKVVNYDYRPLLPVVRSIEAEIIRAKQIDPAFLDYIADWHYSQVYCGRSTVRQ